MANKNPIAVRFVGLLEDEAAPAAALYQLDRGGAPSAKLATIRDGQLDFDLERLKDVPIAIGPDVEDLGAIDPAALLRYRSADVVADWKRRGILIPKDQWIGLLFDTICVSGRVRKCRPWWYDKAVYAERVSPKLGVRPPLPHPGIGDLSNIYLPFRCQPLCEGVVEIFERHCCCPYIDFGDLLGRLRELLEVIPVDIGSPVPPKPEPGPGWRLAELGGNLAAPRGARASSRPLLRLTDTAVSERIYHDYRALARMSRLEAEAYVHARPYLYPYCCRCTMQRVGTTYLRPGGVFDFCYGRPRRPTHYHEHCHTTFAYRVKQQVNGFWMTVYDGVAGHDYFAQGEEADLHTSNPWARPCGEGPEPPDPGEGEPFVMLEYVTAPGTHHSKFPLQTAVSRVGALDPDSGLYDFGGFLDCPWGGSLELRLWASPALDGIVVYYRLKVVRVDAAGAPIGTPQVLGAAVIWSRYVKVAGTIVTTSDALDADPASVGGEAGLFQMPYWTSKDWLSGQPHQTWDTTQFPDGRYMLILELFGPGGARIKPNGAPGSDPGAAQPFQFRRWDAPASTANVPFADCAHVFNINNTPVNSKLDPRDGIFDLRRNGVRSSDDCQFMSGPGTTTFSVGFCAYHVDGVTTGGGPGDTNSFMRGYSLVWQRGLNGPTGTLETGTADQGELGEAESNSIDFATLLGPHTRCSFSVRLYVVAKHHNGQTFLGGDYDYEETASFALEMT